MSRIITNNYLEKLNSTLERFEISDNLSSLLGFFTEEVQKDQNRKGSRNRKVFNKNDLKRVKKLNESEKLKRIFAYVNTIIKAFKRKYLQIHINEDLPESLINGLITLITWQELVNDSYSKANLVRQIKELEVELEKDLVGSGNNDKHKLNKLYKNRYGQKHRKKLLNKIMQLPGTNKVQGTLLNLNGSELSNVKLSEFSEFHESMSSYSYINFGNSLQSIYEDNETALKTTNTIISLFPAERGSNIWFQDFMAENINSWNQLQEFNFEKVITITSGYKTPEALLEMQKRNKFQVEENYTIFSFEI